MEMNTMTLSEIKSKGSYFIGILIYRILLDIAFVYCIAPNYSYYMNLMTDIHINKIIFSYMIVAVLMLIMPYKSNHISNILLNVQFLVMLLPMISLYAMSNRSTIFVMVVSLAHILQCLIVWLAHQHRYQNANIIISNGRTLVLLILCFLLGISLVYSLGKYGIVSLEAFNLTKVYDIRQDISYGFPFSYLLPWTFKVVCIVVLLISLEKKYYIGAVGACLFQIYFYLVYANKQTLFSLILVLGCYWLVKKADLIKGMIYGLILLLVMSGAVYKILGNILLLSYLVRRTLFVPATIKFAYYDFFSTNAKLHFADNSIGHLLQIASPYDLEAPKLIANYLEVPDSYCNSGYWGDAFANFGYIGIIIFSLILIFIILWIEKIVRYIPNAIYVPLLVTLFYNLNDSALLTWCLGGGGGLTIFILWLYRNYRKNKQNYEDANKKIQKNYT